MSSVGKMRVSKAVSGSQKLGSVEIQQDGGRRRPARVATIMLNASIAIILVIFEGVAYFADLPIVCGSGHTTSLPVYSSERRIVPHSSWSLRQQTHTIQLAHPTPYAVVKHTAGPECFGLHNCTSVLRAIQELHWQMYDQPDISYNFLIDSNGNIYEGRGWNNTNPSKGIALRCNVDVALIGNYVERNMTKGMSSALRWLLEKGVSTGMLAPDYRLLAHNQVKNTLSPGRWALLEIADWPHRCLEHCDQGVVCTQPADSDDSSGH
ncbi:peptidoglycan-recognition protein SC1a/b-like [Schistocerca serialis cubense]|uniref:peptidoglycan-recognition protein SC1a/b-like n=1 Tax=Schistocerca serialis cubense TaxID=2023355 RepID=UPI00214EADAF|nr:peptidoglycan-recognition protein SC1a/b-like [Schistocerca serialis cubense]